MFSDPSQFVVKIFVLLFAITVHEYAHGRAALALGDPTAKNQGRLTMNPLSHIDPIGAICLFLVNFGWAKPVPVEARYLKNIRTDMIKISLAGPAANLTVALMAGLMIRFIPLPWDAYYTLLVYMLIMNIGLGLFNLLPLPPLDGSHVLENMLSPEAARAYREFGRYAPFLLIGIILLDRFAHTGIISSLLTGPMLALARLFAGSNIL
jgi:Zn-dependent protease